MRLSLQAIVGGPGVGLVGDGHATELTSGDINRALGAELKKIREAKGWEREDVARRMSSNVNARAVTSWELGTRGLGFARLVDICEALEVSPSVVVASAMRACRIEQSPGEVYVDLTAVLKKKEKGFAGLRRWAESRLDSHAAVVRLEPAVVEEMAVMLGIPQPDLEQALRECAPRWKPCRIIWEA
jgi:transcriptional regulator with XRE-family HTH domain